MLTHRQMFLRSVGQTSTLPLGLEIVRASGVWMYGPNGERYLDLISGIGVSQTGHCHPKVVAAIQNQASKYAHLMVYGELVQHPQTLLAEKLKQTLPKNLDSVFFVNSGAEALDGAIKLARRATGRPYIYSANEAYHGGTIGALSVGSTEFFKRRYRPLSPGTFRFEYGDLSFLDDLNESVAAVVLETIRGEKGALPPPSGYLKAVKAKCQALGILLILDEIQCGIGRTGTFWAFEQEEVEPDVLLTAKALGGGLPLGAFIASKERMSVLADNPFLGHLTTFGGHPISCAAALAAIEVIEEDSLVAMVAQKAERFRSQLLAPNIKAIYGRGLMMAIKLNSFNQVQWVIGECLKKGVFSDWFLFCDDAIRLAPPLIISNEEIDFACSVLNEVIFKSQFIS